MNKTDFNDQESFEALMNESVETQFSWIKTISVISLLAISIFLGFFLFSSYQDKVLISSEDLAFEENNMLDVDEKNKLIETKSLQEESAEKSLLTEVLKEEGPSPKAVTMPAENKSSTHSNTKKIDENKPIAKSALFRVVSKTFDNFEKAKQYNKSLVKKGFEPYIWTRKEQGKSKYNVQLGAFKQLSRAELHQKNLGNKGLETFIVNQ